MIGGKHVVPDGITERKVVDIKIQPKKFTYNQQY